MKTSTLASLYAVGAIAALLILTAWGNAVAMLIVSAIGVVVGLLTLGRGYARHRLLAAALVSCAVAVVVAVMLLRR